MGRPSVAGVRREQIVDALACLAETNADFLALGFPRTRARAAWEAAGAIVRNLRAPSLEEGNHA